jgi:hypothetical protein
VTVGERRPVRIEGPMSQPDLRKGMPRRAGWRVGHSSRGSSPAFVEPVFASLLHDDSVSFLSSRGAAKALI